METVQERLRFLRTEKLKMTQADFAEKIGFKGASIVNQMESGYRSITDRTIREICNQFNVSKNWMWQGTGDVFTLSVSDPEKAYDPHGGYKGHDFSELTGLEGDAYRRAFRILLEIFESTAAAKYQRAIMTHLEVFSEAIKTEARLEQLEKQVAELTSIGQKQSRSSNDRRRTPGISPDGIEKRSGEDRRAQRAVNNGNTI